MLPVSCAGNSVGQNAFFGWSFKPAQVVSMWSAESDNWNFATQSCKPGKVCGHWTQVYSIPFHRFISGNEAHTDETKIRQEDKESVRRKKTEAQKTQQHAVKQSKHKEHTYTSTQLT